jgi:hypothetical protein
MGGQSSGRRGARSCRFLKSAVYIIATSAGPHNPASTGPRPLPTCSLDYYSSSRLSSVPRGQSHLSVPGPIAEACRLPCGIAAGHPLACRQAC